MDEAPKTQAAIWATRIVRDSANQLPAGWRDPPPLEWSILKYGF
jgi:hypothetical protein